MRPSNTKRETFHHPLATPELANIIRAFESGAAAKVLDARPPRSRDLVAKPVAIIMGSQSDWVTMKHAAETLDALGVDHDVRIVSAHRTPDRLYAFARGAKAAGVRVIIAGAGGAAHLPGMTAAMTILPVFGVPVESKALAGVDSLYSIVQMPPGVPVGTLAIGRGGAINAALLAASVLALSDEALADRLEAWRRRQTDAVAEVPGQSADEVSGGESSA